MKAILQVLGSIVFSAIAAALILLITIGPFIWFLNAGTFVRIIIVLFWTVIQSLASSLITVLIIPYIWLVRDNAVAAFVSNLIIVGLALRYIILLWRSYPVEGFFMVLLAIIVTCAIIRNVYLTVSAIILARDRGVQ